MRRKIGIFLVFGAVAPLLVASAAWACGVLATLSLDKKVAAPGEVVNASGRNYSTAAGTSPVTIRLQARDGRELATTAAQTGGRIGTSFPVPANLSPGWYVIVATQFNANGTPKSGTPGRTTLRVQGAASKSADVAPAAWGSKPSGPAASTASAGGSGSLLVLLFAGALSLTMLAGGWKLLSRRGRGFGQPVGA